MKIDFLIKEEAGDLAKKYGNPRRSQISDEEATDLTAEDLIPHQEVVVTQSQRGYVKRVPADTYRQQRRGGRGIVGMVTRERDAVHRLCIADTHDNLLIFTDRGKVYQLRCHEIPDASRQGRGLPWVQLVNLAPGEQVTEILHIQSFERADFLIMATRQGEVKKTPLSEFAQVRSSGLIATDLEPGDELVAARIAKAGDELILVSAQAQAIRFPVDALRTASRQSGGVRGMRLADGDYVAAMDIVIPEADLLIVSANGFGKRTPLSEFSTHAARRQRRDGHAIERPQRTPGNRTRGLPSPGAHPYLAERDRPADFHGKRLPYWARHTGA